MDTTLSPAVLVPEHSKNAAVCDAINKLLFDIVPPARNSITPKKPAKFRQITKHICEMFLPVSDNWWAERHDEQDDGEEYSDSRNEIQTAFPLFTAGFNTVLDGLVISFNGYALATAMTNNYSPSTASSVRATGYFTGVIRLPTEVNNEQDICEYLESLCDLGDDAALMFLSSMNALSFTEKRTLRGA
jgi:hypothetical protein